MNLFHLNRVEAYVAMKKNNIAFIGGYEPLTAEIFKNSKNNYSNTIFYLKLVLFFAGLFAIVLIFLSAKKIELSTEVPFAKDINVTSLNDGLTKPLHSSITNSGDVLQIAAEQIISTNK